MIFRNVIDFLKVIYAKILGKKIALCDIGDVDGILSAAIFKKVYRNSIIILRAPAQVIRSKWIKLFTWDFVADLPCPGKVIIRADHHITNKPCAKIEFYDPNAPCSVILAAKAFNLENDFEVSKWIKIAIETDTANIVSEEAKLLDLAVRYAGYKEKLYIINKIVNLGIENSLKDEKIRKIINRGIEAMKIIQEISSKLPNEEILTIYSPCKLPISYRQLTIEIQKKKNVKFINILVKLGYRTYRLYCGSCKESNYDCTVVAKALGGGGHKFAAGAQFKVCVFRPREGLYRFIRVCKNYLNVDKLSLYVIDKDLNIREEII